MLSSFSPIPTSITVKADRSTSNYEDFEITTIGFVDQDSVISIRWSNTLNNWDEMQFVANDTNISQIYIIIMVDIDSGIIGNSEDDTQVYFEIVNPSDESFVISYDDWTDVTLEEDYFGEGLDSVLYSYEPVPHEEVYLFDEGGVYTVYVSYEISYLV